MSKHFSIFQTETQFNTASTTLDYPHVSLIDTTGEVKFFHKFLGRDIIDADFGDVIMAEVTTNKLFNIKDSEYNLTDYPLESYKPIAVCIYDKASNGNNYAVFMAVQWADDTNLGIPNSTKKPMFWGFYDVNLTIQDGRFGNNEAIVTNSKDINNIMKNLVNVDYSGSSYSGGTGDGSSAAFCSAWRFETVGTSAGDWILPTRYDLGKYKQNYSSINSILNTIKTVAGTSYLNTVNDIIWAAAERDAKKSYYLATNNTWGDLNKNGSTAYFPSVRPVFIAELEQV